MKTSFVLFLTRRQRSKFRLKPAINRRPPVWTRRKRPSLDLSDRSETAVIEQVIDTNEVFLRQVHYVKENMDADADSGNGASERTLYSSLS